MTNKLMEAIEFASNAHKGQMYGDVPYTEHLYDVVYNLQTYGNFDDDVIMAGWLHDTLEDTTTTLSDIITTFGKEVARLVFACTDEQGDNRKERQARTCPKLIAAGPKAIVIKIADRIANIQRCIQLRDQKRLRMYQKEHHDLKEALQKMTSNQETEALWNAFDLVDFQSRELCILRG